MEIQNNISSSTLVFFIYKFIIAFMRNYTLLLYCNVIFGNKMNFARVRLLMKKVIV